MAAASDTARALNAEDDYATGRAARLKRAGFPKMMACLGACGKHRMTFDPGPRVCEGCSESNGSRGLYCDAVDAQSRSGWNKTATATQNMRGFYRD